MRSVLGIDATIVHAYRKTWALPSVPSQAYFAGEATDSESASLLWMEAAGLVRMLGHNWWLVTEHGAARLRFAYVLSSPAQVFGIRANVSLHNLTTLELLLTLVRDGPRGRHTVALKPN
jgi:hypothetical protein